MAIFSIKNPKRHPLRYQGNAAATIGAEHRWTILLWTWRWVVIDARIVSMLIGCSKKTAVNKLRQIEQRGLIQAQFRGGRKVYWLTQQGGRVVREIARDQPDRPDVPMAKLRVKTEPSRWPAPGQIPHELLAQIYTLRAMQIMEGPKQKGTVQRVGCSREFLAEDPYWSSIIEYRGRPIVPDAGVHWICQEGKDRYWFLEVEIDKEKSERERSRRIFHYHRMLLSHHTKIDAAFVFASESTAATWNATTAYQEELHTTMYDGVVYHEWRRKLTHSGGYIEADEFSTRLKFVTLHSEYRIYLPEHRR